MHLGWYSVPFFLPLDDNITQIAEQVITVGSEQVVTDAPAGFALYQDIHPSEYRQSCGFL